MGLKIERGAPDYSELPDTEERECPGCKGCGKEGRGVFIRIANSNIYVCPKRVGPLIPTGERLNEPREGHG